MQFFKSLLLVLVATTSLYGQCPSADVVLITQAQVDDFVTQNFACSIIEGDLVIGQNVMDISGLVFIEEITGRLRINGYQGSDLTGINQISSLGEELFIENCSNLTVIDGFNQLRGDYSGAVTIRDNNSLSEIHGFSQLNRVAGAIAILNNQSLTEVTAFSAANCLGQLYVEGSPLLDSLAGFNAVDTFINGVLLIRLPALTNLNDFLNLRFAPTISLDRTGLVSVSGLYNLAPAEVFLIDIRDNSSLSACSLNNFCEMLNLNPDIFALSGNSTGCNSANEILANCTPSTYSCSPEIPSVSVLNISTGIDENGNLINDQEVDPYWQLQNLPLLQGGNAGSVNPDTVYAVANFNSSWNNITGVVPASKALNVLRGANFGINNQFPETNPWEIRRTFCVCEETEVTISGIHRADDQGKVFLHGENLTGLPISIGTTTLGPSTNSFYLDHPFTWTGTLPAGAYELEYEMANLRSVAMGFSLGGTISSTNSTAVLVNGREGMCNTGLVSIQKIIDTNCDESRNNGEPGGVGWAFQVRNVTTGDIVTGVTDENGELLFRHLPFGDYEITETVVVPWIATSPTNGTQSVTLTAENSIQQIDFLNQSPETCSCIDADVFTISSTPAELQCCYELQLDNDFGEYYDKIGLISSGVTAELSEELATFGLVSVVDDTIFVSGIVPEATGTRAFQFCLNGAVGPTTVNVNWYHSDTIVCRESISLQCPDCPGFDVEQLSSFDDCCPRFDYSAINENAITAVNISLLNTDAKIDHDNMNLPVGFWTPNVGDYEVMLVPLNGIFPDRVDNLIDFCFKENTGSSQTVILDYLASDYASIICSDTFSFRCEPSPVCLELFVTDETIELDCERDSFNLSFTFEKPEDYLDSVGRVVVHITSPVFFQQEIIYDLTTPIGPGELLTVDTLLPVLEGLQGQDICFLITAHDGPEERICCFADSLCLPFPVCEIEYPCDSIIASLIPIEDQTCCFDVAINNLYASNPDLLDSVVVRIGDGPNDQFSGYGGIFPPLPGWTVNPSELFRSFTAVPNGDGIPFTGPDNGIKLLEVCVESDFSIDSTEVIVEYFGNNELVCADTVSAICPACLTVDSDTLACNDGNYLYQFTFTNYSEYPVNAISIINSEGSPDQVDNAQLHTLGTTVQPGGRYTSSIPVQLLDLDDDGSACFDAVLRYIVPEEGIRIFCCFSTICIDLPACGLLEPWDCQLTEEGRQLFPPFLYRPVCGCDDITYANSIYAQRRQLNTYQSEECNGRTNPVGLSVNVNFPVYAVMEDAYQFTIPDLPISTSPWEWFVIQRQDETQGEWTTITTIEAPFANDPLLVDFPIALGNYSYQLVIVNSLGYPFYSEVVTLGGTTGRLDVTAFPNPVDGVLQINSNVEGAATLRVISPAGLVEIEQAVEFGTVPVRVNVSRQPAGVYTIEVRHADGTIGYKRYVKQ